MTDTNNAQGAGQGQDPVRVAPGQPAPMDPGAARLFGPDARFAPKPVTAADLIGTPGFSLKDHGFDDNRLADAVTREIMRINSPDYIAARTQVNKHLHEQAEAKAEAERAEQFQADVKNERLSGVDKGKIEAQAVAKAQDELRMGLIKPGELKQRITDLETAGVEKLRRERVLSRDFNVTLRAQAHECRARI